MIIGLMGAKGSGKDTAAAHLVEKYGFERRAFADPLKRSVAALFDIPFSDVDKYKLDTECRVSMGYHIDDQGQTFDSEPVISNLTFRQMLQRYGTEAHRDIFGEDFWVDQTLPVGGYYPGRKIVVTDCRFENEANRIKELHGYLIRINRPDLGDLNDGHSSENDWFDIKPNITIYNNGTIEKLNITISEALGELFSGPDRA